VLTRQPFCTAGATHPLVRAAVERGRYIPVFPGPFVECHVRSSCIVTGSENIVVHRLCESGSSNPVRLPNASLLGSISTVAADTHRTPRVIFLNGASSFERNHTPSPTHAARSSLHLRSAHRGVQPRRRDHREPSRRMICDGSTSDRRAPLNLARIERWDRTETTSRLRPPILLKNTRRN
jgi:hypothetical protein